MKDDIGPWYAVKYIMDLRTNKKSPDGVTLRVRGCIEQLAQRELELRAKLMLLGIV